MFAEVLKFKKSSNRGFESSKFFLVNGHVVKVFKVFVGEIFVFDGCLQVLKGFGSFF